MEKLNLFFADVLRKSTLSDEQTMALQEMFFPGRDDNPNKARIQGIGDMSRAYEEWKTKQAQKPKQPEKVKPMTDNEIEDLAAIM